MGKPQSLDSVPDYVAISREEILARRQEPSLAIVDVMPPESFRAAHIPNAINVPIEEIEPKAGRSLANHSQEIAIYCAGPT